MGDEEFEKYLDSCFEELERKQDYLASWHAEIPQRTHTDD